MLGLRLQVSGEPQKENVRELLQTAPPITTRELQRASFLCDRGYTDEEFLAQEALDSFDAVAINNKAARNPFILAEQKADWLAGMGQKQVDTTKVKE